MPRVVMCSQTALAALDFRQWLGGEQKINDYCHSLALSGGRLLSRLLGTPLLDPTGEFTLNMVNVGLPLAPSTPDNADTFGIFWHNLLEVWQVSAVPFKYNDRWWVRVSAQVWNEVNPRCYIDWNSAYLSQVSDFEYLAKALKDSCEKLESNHRRRDSVKL
jgi:hercynylcysteine S-oxide lyase